MRSAELYVALIIAIWTYAIAALATSIITCIRTAEWLLLIAVAVFPPVGVAHGTGVWLGIW